MDKKKISILYIEDNSADVVLLRELLSEEQNLEFVLEDVDTLSAGLERLEAGGIDLVLLDLSLPDSQGSTTFFIVREAVKNIPIILMTGLQDEDVALQLVQKGAQDYLLKGDINGTLLVRSFRYAIEREKLSALLRDALEQIYTLKGLIPICSSCKNVRDDKGYWQRVESYLSQYSSVKFSHGICPVCAKKLYPEYCENLSNTSLR
jgi:CheY-like chemotaxis protein